MMAAHGELLEYENLAGMLVSSLHKQIALDVSRHLVVGHISGLSSLACAL